jgi:hypothetical protein
VQGGPQAHPFVPSEVEGRAIHAGVSTSLDTNGEELSPSPLEVEGGVEPTSPRLV